MPIVIRLDHRDVHFRVWALIEDLACESREIREVQPGEHAACGHVTDAFIDIPATPPHLVVAMCIGVKIFAGLAGGRVQTQVSARSSHVPPLLSAFVVLNDLRRMLLVLGGKAAFKDVRGLTDMVVYADQDEVFGAHVRVSTG